MTQASTNSTFKNQGFADTTGIVTINQTLTVEFRAVDPDADELLANFPYVWVNTTTSLMKFSVDGVLANIETVTST